MKAHAQKIKDPNNNGAEFSINRSSREVYSNDRVAPKHLFKATPVLPNDKMALGPDVSAESVAARGFFSFPRQLPHVSQIQKYFGRHDITNVSAYIGRGAREANEILGAKGFTIGNKIALRESSNLHTAAHEAAHVLQQRKIGAFCDEVWKASDRYEHEADAVANAVVAGRSAEPILNRLKVSGTPLATRPVLQRKPAKLSWSQVDVTFNAWFRELGDIDRALAKTRAQIGPPMPDDYVPPPRRKKTKPVKQVKRYKLTGPHGKEVLLTEEEYDQARKEAKDYLLEKLEAIKVEASRQAEDHRAHLNRRNAFGVATDWVIGIEPPPLTIWDWPNPALQAAHTALQSEDLKEAEKQTRIADRKLIEAITDWSTYISELNIGGDKTVEYLEDTKTAADVTFTVAAVFATGGAATALVIAKPIAEETVIAGAKIAMGDEVDWGDFAFNIALQLVLAVATKSMGNKLAQNPATKELIRRVGQSVVKSAIKNVVEGFGTQLVSQAVRAVYDSLRGRKVTWSQFQQQVLSYLTRWDGALLDALTGALGARHSQRQSGQQLQKPSVETTPLQPKRPDVPAVKPIKQSPPAQFTGKSDTKTKRKQKKPESLPAALIDAPAKTAATKAPKTTTSTPKPFEPPLKSQQDQPSVAVSTPLSTGTQHKPVAISQTPQLPEKTQTHVASPRKPSVDSPPTSPPKKPPFASSAAEPPPRKRGDQERGKEGGGKLPTDEAVLEKDPYEIPPEFIDQAMKAQEPNEEAASKKDPYEIPPEFIDQAMKAQDEKARRIVKEMVADYDASDAPPRETGRVGQQQEVILVPVGGQEQVFQIGQKTANQPAIESSKFSVEGKKKPVKAEASNPKLAATNRKVQVEHKKAQKLLDDVNAIEKSQKRYQEGGYPHPFEKQKEVVRDPKMPDEMVAQSQEAKTTAKTALPSTVALGKKPDLADQPPAKGPSPAPRTKPDQARPHPALFQTKTTGPTPVATTPSSPASAAKPGPSEPLHSSEGIELPEWFKHAMEPGGKAPRLPRLEQHRRFKSRRTREKPTVARSRRRHKELRDAGIEPTAQPPTRRPRREGPTRQQQLEGIPLERESHSARAEFQKVRDSYAKDLGVQKGEDVHHAIELDTLNRYPGAFTSNELNAFENMRGIPAESGGKKALHGEAIRNEWDRHYRELDKIINHRGLKPGTPEYNRLVRNYLKAARDQIDHVLGQFFSEYRRGKPRSFK